MAFYGRIYDLLNYSQSRIIFIQSLVKKKSLKKNVLIKKSVFANACSFMHFYFFKEIKSRCITYE